MRLLKCSRNNRPSPDNQTGSRGNAGSPFDFVMEACYQEVSEGRGPPIAARIDRLCRSGGAFAAPPQTIPVTQKSGEATFFNMRKLGLPVFASSTRAFHLTRRMPQGIIATASPKRGTKRSQFDPIVPFYTGAVRLRKGGASMRKHRRWPMLLGVFLFTLGLLLLLSALVETPADVSATVMPVTSIADTMLIPAVPPTPETATAGNVLQQTYLTFMLFFCLALTLPKLVTASDANGRVLRKKRYARSYYPVFRQDLACG